MHRQAYSAPSACDLETVRRCYGDMAEAMPPVVLVFMAETFGSAGWPIRKVGDRWELVTDLQQIRLDVRGPREMRLRSWGREQDRDLFDPAIDRILKCAKE